MKSKADMRRLVTSEESVELEMLLLSVSAWLLLEPEGASAALAVDLESPWSSIIQIRVWQVSEVCVCQLTQKQ